ncbi:MAG: agmatine deiminase family protein [Myxococcota bacterium]|nr:agmatine deiminase family protein [Myxococcota bacterium]
MKQIETPPGKSGFRMPAEWEPHEATWLAWPSSPETFPNELRSAKNTLARCAAALTQPHGATHAWERVRLLLRQEAEEEARELIRFWDGRLDRVDLIHIPTNDVWIRDYGPIFLVKENSEIPKIVLDNEFDSWGGKGTEYYGDMDGLDNQVPSHAAEFLDLPLYQTRQLIEGGAFDTNGQGLVLTTTNCLIERDKNAPTKEEFENYFRENLGIEKTIWLDGIDFPGDDTEGHVDNVARFVAPNKIALVQANQKQPKCQERLRKIARQLRQQTTLTGETIEVVELPLPQPVRHFTTRDGQLDNHDYPASYANFYIGNGVVLVPTYGVAEDIEALTTLQALFPNRDILNIDCSIYILGQGAIHCSTQQEPKVREGAQEIVPTA